MRRMANPSPASESELEAARAHLIRRNRTEGWGHIAKSLGLPWSTVYHFAMRGYIPKRPDIVEKLLGGVEGMIVQHVRRDRLGRFAKKGA